MEIVVTEFCFNNPAGGTAISDGSFNNEAYPHQTATVTPDQGLARLRVRLAVHRYFCRSTTDGVLGGARPCH